MILKGFFRQHGWRYLPGLVFLIANAYLDVLPPRLIGNVMDLLSGAVINERAVRLTLLYLICAGAGIFLTRVIWRSFINGNARRLEMWLRRQLFTHLQALSVEFYSHQKTGDLMAYAVNDVNAIRMTLGPGFALASMSLFTGAFSIARMSSGVDLGLSLLALIPVPIVLAVILKMGAEGRRRFRKVQEAFASVSDRVQESITGIRVIKSYAQEDSEVCRFEPLNERMLKTNVDMVKISAAISPMVALAFGISFTLSLIYGSSLVRAGSISVGDFVAFNGYLMLIIFPVQAVARVTNILQRGLASLRRFEDILMVNPDIADPPGKYTGRLSGALEVRSLDFAYPTAGGNALTGIDLALAPGRTLGILGHTGSGKTTLANILARLHNPPRNTVFFDGIDILDIGLDALHAAIGYALQDNFLFSATVADNIAFYAPDATRADIEAAARVAGIYDSIAGFPGGFDTMVGERGVTLSGGQKQRIAIARALIRKPALLILDDALSAVDAQTEKQIWAQLRGQFQSGMAGIIIAHRVSALAACDEIIVLEGGRIIERGDHDSLMASGGAYAKTAIDQAGEEGVS